MTLITGDPGFAEEVAQESLLRACQRWSTVRTAESRSAWTHRVALNLVSSHFRRMRVRRRAQSKLLSPEAAPVSDVADRVAIRAALAALPVSQRQALVCRYYADLSVRETAAVMQCPENTVKTHTRRALERLRSAGLIDAAPDPLEIAPGGSHDE